jgi:sugar-specific transcriptional regulator TrmB
MASDTPEKPRATAIEQLESLGLSTYAARTFVALVGLSDGTAQEVSDVAEVPRTRVYDAASELETRGLVDVQESVPKRFWAVSSETTERQFEREHVHRLSLLTDALGVIEPDSPSDRERGVRTVGGRNPISDCVVDFIDTATDEVVYLSAEELLTGRIVDSLRSANERGVRITVSDHPPAVTEAIQDAVPGVVQFDASCIRPTTAIGRLVVADGTNAVVSVVGPARESPVGSSAAGTVADESTADATDATSAAHSVAGESSPAPDNETAIVGTGDGNSLVAILEQLL